MEKPQRRRRRPWTDVEKISRRIRKNIVELTNEFNEQKPTEMEQRKLKICTLLDAASKNLALARKHIKGFSRFVDKIFVSRTANSLRELIRADEEPEGRPLVSFQNGRNEVWLSIFESNFVLTELVEATEETLPYYRVVAFHDFGKMVAPGLVEFLTRLNSPQNVAEEVITLTEIASENFLREND